MNLPSELVWLKACGSSACLEVAHTPNVVYIRSTRDNVMLLTVTPQEWREFVDHIHSGKIA